MKANIGNWTVEGSVDEIKQLLNPSEKSVPRVKPVVKSQALSPEDAEFMRLYQHHKGRKRNGLKALGKKLNLAISTLHGKAFQIRHKK